MSNLKQNGRELPRIQIQVEPAVKSAFTKKVHSEGYTIRGLVSLWIKKYLADDLPSSESAQSIEGAA